MYNNRNGAAASSGGETPPPDGKNIARMPSTSEDEATQIELMQIPLPSDPPIQIETIENDAWNLQAPARPYEHIPLPPLSAHGQAVIPVTRVGVSGVVQAGRSGEPRVSQTCNSRPTIHQWGQEEPPSTSSARNLALTRAEHYRSSSNFIQMCGNRNGAAASGGGETLPLDGKNNASTSEAEATQIVLMQIPLPSDPPIKIKTIENDAGNLAPQAPARPRVQAVKPVPRTGVSGVVQAGGSGEPRVSHTCNCRRTMNQLYARNAYLEEQYRQISLYREELDTWLLRHLQ